MTRRVVVIGGGAAGMMAAYAAALEGAQATLLERNAAVGKKLLITGKGRCNLTNSCNHDEFIANIPGNGRFLYSALSVFDNRKLMELFESNGCRLKVERGGRVFPVSDMARSIVETLQKILNRSNVRIVNNCRVTEIDAEARVCRTSAGEYAFDALIVATGGMSYPGTGSSGDGYSLAESLGIKTIARRPALVPLVSGETWLPAVQGLSLRNVRVTLYQGRRKIAEEFGEMLFTHFGLSGPVILTLSRRLCDADFATGDYQAEINLKPALTQETLDARLRRDFAKNPRKILKNGFADLLPHSLIETFTALLPVDGSKQIAQLTKKDRQEILQLLQHLPVRITGLRPVGEAIVTAGGIDVKELQPGTMRSKKHEWLYFAGEVIDVDAYTGGFNLQIAFSTGYVAGSAAAKNI